MKSNPEEVFTSIGDASSRRDFLIRGTSGLVGLAALEYAPVLGAVPISLTLTSVQARAVNSGGSFTHRITLRNGSSPISNASVGIYDPIARLCAFRRTNSQGQVDYTTSTSSATQPSAYTFVALYENTRATSTVAVRPSTSFTLPNFKLDFLSNSAPSSSTLVCSKRAPGNGLAQSIPTTSTQAVSFGREVATNYLSNPGNLGKIAITALSCTAGQTIPAAGQAACLVGIRLIAADIAAESLKLLTKRLIDRSGLSSTDKQRAKTVVDAASVAYEIASFQPDAGFELVSAVSTSWDFSSVVADLIVVSGSPRGVSVAGQINGSSKVLQIACYKR